MKLSSALANIHKRVPSGRKEQIILDDAPERADAVAPADLFPFGIGSSAVGYGHFIDPCLQTADLGDDFGFKSKAVFPDFDFLNNLAPEGFEA